MNTLTRIVLVLIAAAVYYMAVIVLFFMSNTILTSLLGFPGTFDEGRMVVGAVVALAGLAALYLLYKALQPPEDSWERMGR